MTASDDILVIGGGIVGVSTAIWLQRKGFAVTIVDREGFAAGTSYGNAGILAASSVIPVTTPQLLPKIPSMLFGRDTPLFLRWTYLPKLLPFLLRYLGHANRKDVKRIAEGLANLMHDSAEQHYALAKGTPAERYMKHSDYLHVYPSRQAFEKDAAGWETRTELGYGYTELDAAGLAEYDPALTNRFGYGVLCPESGQITDPGEYTRALGQHFIDQGGRLEIAAVEEIITENGRAVGIRTSAGEMQASRIVVASGAWSGDMVRKLGLKVPMESERGYHVEYVNPNLHFRVPFMVAEAKFAVNSMEGRLRCAGVAEFGGLAAGPSRQPVEYLKRRTASLFPDLEYDDVRVWMGHRPSTTDSMPMIGTLPNVPNVWAGFGHQHLGLTGGPKTGRWLAQLVSGEMPNTDLTAYAPDRFS